MVEDKKPMQLAIRLPLVILVAVLLMLGVGLWFYAR